MKNEVPHEHEKRRGNEVCYKLGQVATATQQLPTILLEMFVRCQIEEHVETLFTVNSVPFASLHVFAPAAAKLVFE